MFNVSRTRTNAFPMVCTMDLVRSSKKFANSLGQRIDEEMKERQERYERRCTLPTSATKELCCNFFLAFMILTRAASIVSTVKGEKLIHMAFTYTYKDKTVNTHGFYTCTKIRPSMSLHCSCT